MSVGNISIDPDLAIASGTKISEYAATYINEVKKIYDIVNDLKQAWTGSAAQRFTNDIESFKEDYEKFGQLLVNYGDILTSLGKDYKSLEENL